MWVNVINYYSILRIFRFTVFFTIIKIKQENEYHLTIFVTDGSQSTEVKSTIIATCPERPPISPFINFQPLFSVHEVWKYKLKKK